MGDTCERTGYEAVQLSTENDTEYVSSGISEQIIRESLLHIPMCYMRC